MSEITVSLEEEEIEVEVKSDVLKGDKGDKGDKGNQGIPGYTPQKGTDYFTTEEIEEIETDVKESVVEEITPTLESKQDEITSQNKLSSDLIDDTNQTNKFTTTTEKTGWNGKYDKPSGGIPKTDLASDVQTSLGKADTAIQSHQDISGKEDKTNKVISISSSSTDTQYPSAKCVYDSQESQDDEIEALQTENARLKATLPTTTGTGENVTLQKTAEMEFVKPPLPGGNSWQETRSGKNKLNLRDIKEARNCDVEISNNTLVVSGIEASNPNPNVWFNCSLDAGTYYIHLNRITSVMNIAFYNENDEKIGSNINSSSAVTLTQKAVKMALNTSSAEGNYSLPFESLYINSGNSDLGYEPYGVMPSPDYPSEIHNVGENVNIFDWNNPRELTLVKSTSRTATASPVTPMELKAGTYSISIPDLELSNNNYPLSVEFSGTGKSASIINKKATITIDENKTLNYLYFYLNSSDNDNSTATFSKIKLEKGLTPTPYSPYGCGNVEVVVGNKNWFTGWIDGENINSTAGTINTSSVSARSDYIPVDFDTYSNYHISHFANSSWIWAYDKDKQPVARSSSTNINADITITESSFNSEIKSNNKIKYIMFRRTGLDYPSDTQIEVGSLRTSFVQHQQQTFLFPLAQGQKLMQGDKLEDDGIHHVRGEKVFDGTENWVWSDTTRYTLNLTQNAKSENGLSSHFIYAKYAGVPVKVDKSFDIVLSSQKIGFHDTEITTLADWKSFLAQQYANGTPVEVEYELAEETIDPYTPEQQAVYNQIKEAISYEEQTHISGSSGDTSPVFDVEAYQSTKLVLQDISNAIVALGGV